MSSVQQLCHVLCGYSSWRAGGLLPLCIRQVQLCWRKALQDSRSPYGVSSSFAQQLHAVSPALRSNFVVVAESPFWKIGQRDLGRTAAELVLQLILPQLLQHATGVKGPVALPQGHLLYVRKRSCKPDLVQRRRLGSLHELVLQSQGAL